MKNCSLYVAGLVTNSKYNMSYLADQWYEKRCQGCELNKFLFEFEFEFTKSSKVRVLCFQFFAFVFDKKRPSLSSS